MFILIKVILKRVLKVLLKSSILTKVLFKSLRSQQSHTKKNSFFSKSYEQCSFITKSYYESSVESVHSEQSSVEMCSSFKNFLLSAMIQLFYLTENLIFRGVESSGKSPLDLCILVLREVNNAHVAVGNLITHSPRQLRCFVGCNVMLEAGEYVVIPLAFNNWNISKWLPVCYCEHTELFFSSTLRL